MRSYCTAQGTTSMINHDGKEYKKKNMCVCVCVCVYIYICKFIFIYIYITVLYSRNWYNVVNQLYSNKNFSKRNLSQSGVQNRRSMKREK